MDDRFKVSLCLGAALLCIGLAGAGVHVFSGRWERTVPTTLAGPALSLRLNENASLHGKNGLAVQNYGYISGAVTNPGMYPISEDARVFDLVIRSMRYSIPPVSSMLSELAEFAGFSPSYTKRVMLAVEEMLAERAMDAYETVGDIHVRLTLWQEYLRISFSDDGSEYFIDKRKETSMNAKIILGSVDNFRTLYKNGKPVYCMDFLYEKDMDILDFLIKGQTDEYC